MNTSTVYSWDDVTLFGAPGYIIVSNSVDYFTAKKACDDNGGHLPMIRTMKEKEDLINFANLHGVNRVWLGGEEVAEDYIKWLSGEEFPVHIWHDNKEWEDFEKYPEVHVHVERDSLKFHADRDRTVEFVCETVEEPRNAGYFVHVADNMQTWALPLAELTVTKKMRCAMECSKSLRCRKYTIKLSVCTLYKDVLFHSSGSGNGESLWIKVF
ncbi:hypothetical protein LOTGIDRAFT_169344 [Lottia gigantea]|uniref:C-type lectin domain-containing protein n=1 Tax=Lottia gigantea TaxID=225164 RepID=V3ZGM2_LOTGI|nr:hypothetical protein LOTGIDRAFT_169344 [Lottia gigantea]ESO83322.1 hypothetical protein LOTGIDRAFT_169344 [Lottia gigantea]